MSGRILVKLIPMLKSISRAAHLLDCDLAHSCTRGGSHDRVIHHDQDSTPVGGNYSVPYTQRSPTTMDNAGGQA